MLLIHELPDTVKKKETEAQAYAAVWDLMAKLEKNLPMAFVFTARTHCWKIIKHMTRSVFFCQTLTFKNLERHVAKAEAILYG